MGFVGSIHGLGKNILAAQRNNVCGFAGYKTTRDVSIDSNLLQTISELLRHRGPDDAGTWHAHDGKVALLSRRLSIIDTSSAGAQPMQDTEGRIVLSFNGELYNHRAVRQELIAHGHNFSSDCDTEVFLNAFKQWGIECLKRFDGMFAGAVYDRSADALYLFRDRMGIKPLYFSLQGEMLSFASEIKALWKMPWMAERISARALSHYLTYLATPAPMTLFEGVYKLPAGFYARYTSPEDISFTQWYDPLVYEQVVDKKDLLKKSYCVSRVRTLLDEAVQKRLQSDVPVGALLSGGLDSSLVVAFMARYTKKLNTFTVAFDGDPLQERSWARKVAKKFGTNHHELILTEQDAFSFFEKMVYYQDEPLGDSVCIPLYFVSKQASDAGVKVLLAGEGSDELFCGYPMYVDYVSMHRYWKLTQHFMPDIARRGLFYAARPFYEGYPNRQDLMKSWAEGRSLFWGGVRVFSELWKDDVLARQDQELFDPIIEKIYPGFPQADDSYAVADYHRSHFYKQNPQGDFFAAMTYIELKHRLPELLLTRTDKMTMAASVEARVPFMDHKLVEFMLQVPMKFKYRQNETKYILKKAAEGLIPNDVIYRKKVGFASPVTRWFKDGGLFVEHFQDQLRSKNRWSELLDTKAIEALLKKNSHSSINYSYQLWALNNVLAFK